MHISFQGLGERRARHMSLAHVCMLCLLALRNSVRHSCGTRQPPARSPNTCRTRHASQWRRARTPQPVQSWTDDSIVQRKLMLLCTARHLCCTCQRHSSHHRPPHAELHVTRTLVTRPASLTSFSEASTLCTGAPTLTRHRHLQVCVLLTCACMAVLACLPAVTERIYCLPLPQAAAVWPAVQPA